MIYAEGKHDDPADTQERLVKVGSKYQATAPAVADGDNVYLLVDASGRIIVAGPAASDSAEAGNPVQIGGSVDDTSPAAAAEDDVRRIRCTPEGNVIVELYKDNDALAPIAAMPGASEVKSVRETVNNTTTRATILTPTSGKKARVISVTIYWDSTSTQYPEVFFGTGVDAAADETKAVLDVRMVAPDQASLYFSWPDGGGPVGAADDVISVRCSLAISANAVFTIHYREE